MRDIYIGLRAEVERKLNPPMFSWVCTHAETLEGLQGEFNVYLVGDYKALPAWSAIDAALKRSNAKLNLIEKP